MDESIVIERHGHSARVIALIENAAVARWPASVMRRVGAAARTSGAMATAGRLAASWRALGRSQQRRASGIVLITAALAHLAAVALHQVPPGWMWLVLPGIVLAEGIVLMLAGSSSREIQ
jgi:hypothetical protein